jgi:hypothetical protein
MTGIVGLGLPVVGTALGWAAHLGWVLPWDGRRSLRATIDVIAKDIEADEQRQHLPAHAQSVQLFVAVLRLVAETPDGWRARLGEELPFVDGSPVPLSAVERARLDRYTGRLEVALVRYGRRVRFSGARVARDVAGVVFDPRSYWNAIDLTGPVVDLDRTSGLSAIDARPEAPTAGSGSDSGGVRTVAGVELGAEAANGGRSPAEAKAARTGPRRRSRH